MLNSIFSQQQRKSFAEMRHSISDNMTRVPNHEKVYRFENYTKLFLSLLGKASSSTHFEKLLTVIMSYLFPKDLKNGTMKLLPQISYN